MKSSADLGGCYTPRPSASVDNTLLDLQNSSYSTQPHSIIAKYHAQPHPIIVYSMFMSYVACVIYSKYMQATNDVIIAVAIALWSREA